MNDLIKKLKNKYYVRAFGLMLPGERACFEKVGLNNCLVFTLTNWGITGNTISFTKSMTYAIKPNYQPEPIKHTCCGTIYCQYCYPDQPKPEYVDLKIISLACSDMPDSARGMIMRREIKFRQIIRVDGKFLRWHYWGFFESDCGCKFVGPIGSPAAGIKDSYQSTGLKDKNGKEGYFDDIIEDEGDRYTVAWDDDLGVAYLKSCLPGSIDLLIEAIKEREIIGDIHTTPELLNETIQS